MKKRGYTVIGYLTTKIGLPIAKGNSASAANASTNAPRQGHEIPTPDGAIARSAMVTATARPSTCALACAPSG